MAGTFVPWPQSAIHLQRSRVRAACVAVAVVPEDQDQMKNFIVQRSPSPQFLPLHRAANQHG